MSPPLPYHSGCVECGKPFAAHRGVQTHVYQRADGFRASNQVPHRPTVDEMATAFLTHDSIDELPITIEARAAGRAMNDLAVALGQAIGMQLQPDTPMSKVAKHLRDPKPIERPRDPNRPLSRAGTPMKHRRFPCAWWQRGCRCYECNRTPDYAHIEAMERECRIKNEEGELVWPDPVVGDRDKHGRTVVAVEPDGTPVWDRMAPPAPPARDMGHKSWV